jgi:hypothetical protein
MTENSTSNNGTETDKKGSEEMSFADLFEMDENSSVSKVGDVIPRYGKKLLKFKLMTGPLTARLKIGSKAACPLILEFRLFSPIHR